MTLGCQAVVRGDVTIVGGTLNRAPGARVFGRIDEVGAVGCAFGGRWRLSDMFGSFSSRLGSLAATVLRITLLVLVMLVGFRGLAHRVGRWLAARFGWTNIGAYAVVAIGVGAAILAWYETQTRFGARRHAPTATPTVPSPSEA